MQSQNTYIPESPNAYRKAVSDTAYFRSHNLAYALEPPERHWWEAETSLDERIFSQHLQAHEFYKVLMCKFFSTVAPDAQDSQNLAKTYLNFIMRNEPLFHKFREIRPRSSVLDFRNVSVLAENTDLAFLTKRSMLIADATLLTHAGSCNHDFWTETINYGGMYRILEHIFHSSSCPDLTELGTWLASCRDLICNGDVFYYPKIEIGKICDNAAHGVGPLYVYRHDPDHVYDAIVSSRKVLDLYGQRRIRSDLVRVIVEIELPYIEVANLSDFSKLTMDKHQHVDVFRDFLREHFLDLIAKEDSEAFDANLAKVGRKIKKGIKSLASDFQTIKRKRIVQSVGAGINTVTASLVVIDSGEFGELPGVLGAAKTSALLKICEEYPSKLGKLQGSPYYYLWLLRPKGH